MDALGCRAIFEIVKREIKPFDHDDIIKVLGVIRHVARRRAHGGRHHMDVLQQYLGAFMETGVGLGKHSGGSELVVG